METAMWLVAHFCDAGGSTRPAGSVADGGECAAFSRWVDGLPAAGNEALKELRECGYAHDLAALGDQLRRGLAGRGVPAGAASVCRRLLNILVRREDAACLLVGPAPDPALPAGH
jgi:hypothetical protein